MDKQTFYRILGQAVKYSKAQDKKYKQLQTFAVLRDRSDFAAESLGRTILDRYKPFFYSRKWEGKKYPAGEVVFEYPALFVIETAPLLETPFAQKSQRCTNMQLMVVYPNIEKLENAGIKAMCEKLLTDEIYTLADDLMRQVFLYLRSTIYATVGGVDGWHNEKKLIADGTTYTKIERQTNAYLKQLIQDNQIANGIFVDDEGKDMLCGVQYAIRFCETSVCNSQENSFDLITCC